MGAEDSSFSQKEHTVSLIKVDGEWIVANVETKYDWFANEYKDTEYKISSIIAAEKQNIQAQAECSANEDSVVSAAPAEDEMVAEVLANASFARMYNKENAWKYAYTYATSTTTSTANSYYNTDIFNDYSGPDAGDCMNFASQAIYAGFSGSNNLTSVNAGTAPQDTVGIAAGQPNAAQTKWYAKPASTYWAWTSCGYFRDYIDYSVNDTETRLRAVKKPITASSDFSEVGTANLIGSIIHVNGSKPLGHAVIVNNATGTARNQIYFTAHSPNAKNLNLAEEYSGQMVSIRPTYFYDVTTCTGANTSHTFSSTNSKCARCGYVRTYIIPTLLTPMAKNTQITLTARTNHTVSSISMSVKNPNGATTNLGTVTNTTSISKVYGPQDRGDHGHPGYADHYHHRHRPDLWRVHPQRDRRHQPFFLRGKACRLRGDRSNHAAVWRIQRRQKPYVQTRLAVFAARHLAGGFIGGAPRSGAKALFSEKTR